jgi:hypothetical protein
MKPFEKYKNDLVAEFGVEKTKKFFDFFDEDSCRGCGGCCLDDPFSDRNEPPPCSALREVVVDGMVFYECSCYAEKPCICEVPKMANDMSCHPFYSALEKNPARTIEALHMRPEISINARKRLTSGGEDE